MLVEEVDRLDAEPRERALDHLLDVLGPTIQATPLPVGTDQAEQEHQAVEADGEVKPTETETATGRERNSSSGTIGGKAPSPSPSTMWRQSIRSVRECSKCADRRRYCQRAVTASAADSILRAATHRQCWYRRRGSIPHECAVRNVVVQAPGPVNTPERWGATCAVTLRCVRGGRGHQLRCRVATARQAADPGADDGDHRVAAYVVT